MRTNRIVKAAGPATATFALLVLLFLLLALIPLAANAQEGEKYPVVKTGYGHFSTETIKETNGALTGGVDAGDADNDGQNELVIGSWSHEVYIIEYNLTRNVWDSWIAYTDELDLLECSIGDYDADGKNEILTGGYSKNLTAISIEGKTVTHETIYKLDADIWDIQVGDLIPEIPGNEIAVAHWQNYISILYQRYDVMIPPMGGPRPWGRYNLTTKGAVTTLEVGEYDSEHDGLEMVTGSEDGYMENFYFEPGPNGTPGDFNSTTIYKENRAIRNVDIGDFCSFTPGNEIVAVSFSMNAGNATMIHGSGSNWTNWDLYNSSRGLEALGVGEMNPNHPGVEAVFAGYANTVTMVADDGANTQALEVWKGNLSIQSELSGVAVNDIHPLIPGGEAYVVGYNGKVRMIAYDTPGTVLDFGLSADMVSIQTGSEMPLHTKVSSRGGFTGSVDITTTIVGKTADPGITVDVQPSFISVKEGEQAPLEMTIHTQETTPEEEFTLQVTLASALDTSVKDTYSLPIRIVGGVVEFALNVIPRTSNASTSKGFNTASYQISVATTSGTVSQDVHLSVSGLPSGSLYQLSESVISHTRASILTVTVEENAQVGVYPLTVVGTNGSISASTTVTLNIIELVGLISLNDLKAEDIGDGNYRFTATLENQGNLPLQDFKVLFLLNDEAIYNPRVDSLEPGEEAQVIVDHKLETGVNTASVYLQDLPDEVAKDGDGMTIYVGEEEHTGGSGIALVVIVIIIILVVIAGAVVFVLYRKKMMDAPEEQDQEEVKFQRTGRGRRDRSVSEKRSKRP